MKPAVICCCEAGTADAPMTSKQMYAMADAMRQAWEHAATDRPKILFLFNDEAPYLTIWDDNRGNCRHGRILKEVYKVPGQQRTAQAFLCTLPGDSDEEGIDVFNVHAPSGAKKLTNPQRMTLMRNLLQSSSKTRVNRPIGKGRFVIGGDMNTKEVFLVPLLNKLKREGILTTKVEVMAPPNGKHGDLCLVGGIKTTMVQERARNHDPRHDPYGIVWRKQSQQSTEQLTATPQTQIPTAPDTTTESRAIGTTAAAVLTAKTGSSSSSDPQVVAVHPEMQPSKQPLEKASASHATEQSHPHEHEEPELKGPEQEMAYAIVNAFLHDVTFEITEADTLIKQVMHKTGGVIRPNMLENIDEVFRPIFFYYPNGLDDRTRAVPRDPRQYISKWRDIAEWRKKVGADDTEQLTQRHVGLILKFYIEDFILNEATIQQKMQSKSKNKSRAEARLCRHCGTVMMAKQIWQVGLPNIAEASSAIKTQILLRTLSLDTEQQRPLEQDVRDSITTATETILNWLSRLANSIQDHKATPAYKEHARKSGTQKNKSGLTQMELSVKEEKKRAAVKKCERQPSRASGSHTWQTPAPEQTSPHSQWRGNTSQTSAQWQQYDDTWQMPASCQMLTQWQWNDETVRCTHWLWHDDTWQKFAKWQ